MTPFWKSTAAALKAAARSILQPSSPRPRTPRSLAKYVKDFESGAANPHGIKVRIHLHGVGTFDEPLKLAANGRLRNSQLPKSKGKS